MTPPTPIEVLARARQRRRINHYGPRMLAAWIAGESEMNVNACVGKLRALRNTGDVERTDDGWWEITDQGMRALEDARSVS